MYCPTKQDILAALVALLPRGRAWQTHQGGPAAPIDPAFADFAFDGEAYETRLRTGSVLHRFWSSIAEVFAFLHARLCALRLEFWCATMSETRPEWMAEYGLPDPCDPFPDLCAKVAALGGARCEYFNAIVARAGWSVDCFDGGNGCGGRAGRARAGCSTAGAQFRSEMTLIVHTNESPAFAGPLQTAPLAGRLRAGQAVRCAADISPLRCLMDRIAPAHVTITYITV